MRDTPSHYFLSFCEVLLKLFSVVFFVIAEKRFLTSDLIVTLTLDIGTHFFIMSYLSVKFHQICFSSL